MRKLLGLFGGLVAWLSVATVAAIGIVAGYLWTTGRIDGPRISRLAEVFRTGGGEPAKADALQPAAADIEQPSFEEILTARSVKYKDIELREQALASDRLETAGELSTLKQELDGYRRLKEQFATELAGLKEGELARARDDVRSILENMKPQQAKDEILRMLEADEMRDVVLLLTSMTTGKRKKIVDEFKTAEEAAKLNEVLTVIRKGEPQTQLIDDTEASLDGLAPVGP